MWFKRREKNDGEAQQAIESATRNLARIESRSEEVTKLSEAVKDIRKKNHFSEALGAAIIRQEGSET